MENKSHGKREREKKETKIKQKKKRKNSASERNTTNFWLYMCVFENKNRGNR